MSIAFSFAAVESRILAACLTTGRDRDRVQLLAVSKTRPIADLAEAAALGQRRFGENYVQEALPKIDALAARGLEWHHIGPIQSNKTADIASHFDWAHGVDRLRIAERLSAQRPAGRAPLNVCVQVNVSGEASKSGCMPADALALCRAVQLLPGLKLRGLMALPAATPDVATQRASFRRLRELFEQLRLEDGAVDTLSMGMSDDLEAAIAEGSTLVRIGSALFGARSAGQTPLLPSS